VSAVERIDTGSDASKDTAMASEQLQAISSWGNVLRSDVMELG
jgi:hypothetical protein